LLFMAGCSPRAPSGPIHVPIDQLRPATEWEGKRITVSGGRVERVQKDYVTVIDPGNKGDRVDLLCYFTGSFGATVENALRGQEVTVVGRVVGPMKMWTLPTVKLEDCEFVLGNPPDTSEEKVLASKGRGQVEAERDIKAGKLMLRFRHSRSGSPPWFPEYQRLLKDRCGVETDERPEVGPMSGLHPDDREYNEIMTKDIEKQYSAGIVERLLKQAAGEQEK
jgi:hypothetical protein